MGLRGAQIADYFWGCLGGHFRKRLTFESASGVRQMAPRMEGGHHPIPESPDKANRWRTGKSTPEDGVVGFDLDKPFNLFKNFDLSSPLQWGNSTCHIPIVGA